MIEDGMMRLAVRFHLELERLTSDCQMLGATPKHCEQVIATGQQRAQTSGERLSEAVPRFLERFKRELLTGATPEGALNTLRRDLGFE